MSEYYQQQMTLYIMRRKKRQAALSTDTPDAWADAENPPVKSGWFSRVTTRFMRGRDRRLSTSQTSQEQTRLTG